MAKAIETHRTRNPRILFFYFATAAMIATLFLGVTWHQLFRSFIYSERERMQNQRRVIVPGPRGNILDREGRVLVGNRPRFSVVLNLGESSLRSELRAEYQRIYRNFRDYEKGDRPSGDQLERMARVSVAQRYLDQVNLILGRRETVNTKDVQRHFSQTLLLPFVLLDDLSAAEYAKLIERLPVNSPLQVYTSSTRAYPSGSVAAHVLGYIGIDNDPEAEDIPGEDLLTFKMKGSFGRAGLEKKFNSTLEGEAGGAIYRVDPAGFKVPPALESHLPVQGQNLHTSLDLDLQVAAEQMMTGRTGAAVALDVRTGEVLVMASKPDYNLTDFVPRLSSAKFKEIEDAGGWLNRAIQGQYPPGSTFKIITSTAGLRSGAIDPTIAHVTCPGYLMVGNRRFVCDEVHGETDIYKAIARSCNVFFYKYGLEMGNTLIAAEAERFGFNHKTGIELDDEFRTPHVATPEWKKDAGHGSWTLGDTANMAIGQGYTLVTPLHVACMMASFARGETSTRPTLIHDPDRPPQHTTPLGLSPSDYNVILEGLRRCYQIGTARLAKVDGLSGAAKTGTAQKGKIDLAWLVAFAPAENPQIAVAVVLEGSENENYHGGTYAAPVVQAILQKWKDKRDAPAAKPFSVKVE